MGPGKMEEGGGQRGGRVIAGGCRARGEGEEGGKARWRRGRREGAKMAEEGGGGGDRGGGGGGGKREGEGRQGQGDPVKWNCRAYGGNRRKGGAGHRERCL